MRKLNYSGAGTIEFLYENGEFYFIEMNTRLQVEHPVTERITGVDLVYEQIRVASGEKLEPQAGGHPVLRPCHRGAHQRRGPADLRPLAGQDHASTTRPAASACASISAVYQGYSIPPYYDRLIGKLIVHGRTRAECLQRLRRAVDEFVVDGIKTTLPLFQRLIKEPDILAGNYDIHWLEKYLAGSTSAASGGALSGGPTGSAIAGEAPVRLAAGAGTCLTAVARSPPAAARTGLGPYGGAMAMGVSAAITRPFAQP